MGNAEPQLTADRLHALVPLEHQAVEPLQPLCLGVDDQLSHENPAKPLALQVALAQALKALGSEEASLGLLRKASPAPVPPMAG